MTFTGGLPSVLVSATTKRADIHVNDLTVDGITQDKYNVKYHGAIGDGIANDQVACQAAVDHAMLNGGDAYFPSGTYLVTRLNLDTPTKSFGLRGDGESSIIKKISGGLNVLNGTDNLLGISIRDLTVDGNETALSAGAGHGIALSSSNNITIERVNVRDYFAAGIIVFVAAGSPGDFDNAWLYNCHIDGSLLANNGMLIVDYHKSGMVGCVVKDLAAAASPGACLQLKNQCDQCVIDSCTATNGRSGVALATDAGTGVLAVTNSTISNCSIKNCIHGLFMSQMVGNTVSNISIDMEERAGSLEPFRIGPGSTLTLAARNNVFKGIKIAGVVAAKTAVFLDEFCNNNYIEIDQISDPLHLNFVSFATDTTFNRVRLNSLGNSVATSAKALIVLDSGTNNELVFQRITSNFDTMASYTVATVPSSGASTNAGLIIVSDETGGLTLAYNDGTNWRRVQDRAIVS